MCVCVSVEISVVVLQVGGDAAGLRADPGGHPADDPADDEAVRDARGRRDAARTPRAHLVLSQRRQL